MSYGVSIFDPTGIEDVEEKLRRAEASECCCGASLHENLFHDLVLTDIPWLLREIAILRAQLAL